MTKTELTKAMRDFAGSSFITRLQLSQFMGYKKPQSVDRYLYPLERIDKKYFIPDVAEQLMSAAYTRG